MTAELWMILGMAAVTVVPRLLPALLPPGLVIPAPVARWLGQVPYAALGALIFPGVVAADPDNPWTGIAAALAAVGAALLRAPAFVAALAAVVAALAVRIA